MGFQLERASLEWFQLFKLSQWSSSPWPQPWPCKCKLAELLKLFANPATTGKNCTHKRATCFQFVVRGMRRSDLLKSKQLALLARSFTLQLISQQAVALMARNWAPRRTAYALSSPVEPVEKVGKASRKRWLTSLVESPVELVAEAVYNPERAESYFFFLL